MGREIFISILGTGYYQKTKYYLNDKDKSVETRFIQEATLKTNSVDKAFLFLTEKARTDNWNSPAQSSDKFVKEGKRGPYDGLEKVLAQNNFSFEILSKSIPDGNNEDEIWEIFERVFSVIEEGDKVYFDITHAFRSLPMLVMVLINYSKFLKRVTVKGITYGNWEGRDVDNFSPIINLTAFSELQDWTSAANEFLYFGNAEKIASLSEYAIKELPKKQKNKLSPFPNSLKKYSKLFSTIRGKDIIEGIEILQLNNKIDDFSKINKIKALDEILRKIKESTTQFEKKTIKNGIIAIDWCIEHNLIQQAITLTQEMTITYLCDFWSEKYGLKFDNKDHREMLSSLFGVQNVKNITVDRWTSSLKVFKDIAMLIEKEVLFNKLIKDYNSLTQIRNSINHGGFIGIMDAKSIEVNFLKYYNNISEIIFTIEEKR